MLSDLFSVDFMPHGYCIRWQPLVLALHIGSDVLIAFAYYTIPLLLLYYTRKRPDVRYNSIFILFAAFIFWCGTSHVMEIIVLWFPAYGVEGIIKAITAVVSMVTVAVLIPSIPRALAFRSPADLEALNQELERQIRDRIQTEKELVQAKQEAEAANRAKSLFLANMSHEIRTPMTSVIGYSDILLEDEHEPEERSQLLRVIRRNGDHLLKILDDILDLARIESGRLTIEASRVRLHDVMETVVSVMRARAIDKGLEFEARIEPGAGGFIRTDATRLRQILINVVGNAIKFTAAGEVSIVVRRDAPDGRHGGKLVFTVRDSGVGIPGDQVGKLFQPFQQIETTKKFGGTGLGLAISRRLAELLGGEIAVESESGRGSTFTIVVDAPAIEDEADAPEAPNTDAAEQLLRGASALVADDYGDGRELVRRMLERLGMSVECAENGLEAVTRVTDRAGRAGYDVLLMDMQMPVMSGFEATRRIRATGYAGSIIALTAFASKAEEELCRDAGCDLFVAKPIDRTKLLPALIESLRRAERSAPTLS